MLRMVRLRNKNVARPDQGDIVPARNSTSTCSGTITNKMCRNLAHRPVPKHLSTGPGSSRRAVHMSVQYTIHHRTVLVILLFRYFRQLRCWLLEASLILRSYRFHLSYQHVIITPFRPGFRLVTLQSDVCLLCKPTEFSQWWGTMAHAGALRPTTRCWMLKIDSMFLSTQTISCWREL